MAPDFTSEIIVRREKNRWRLTDLDGNEALYAYRTDAVAKARLLRLAARRRGLAACIVICEPNGGRTLVR